VSFKNCVIIMTSNLGSAQIFEHLPSDSREDLKARVMAEVRSHFRYGKVTPLHPAAGHTCLWLSLAQPAQPAWRYAVYVTEAAALFDGRRLQPHRMNHTVRASQLAQHACGSAYLLILQSLHFPSRPFNTGTLQDTRNCRPELWACMSAGLVPPSNPPFPTV
jgi:hypothetical protein